MPILSIQSHVAYGHVGNAAAVFPLQRLGFEVWPIHTVQFAAHTGYGRPKGRVFDAAMIADVMDGIAERPDFASCEAVLSGYIGSTGIGSAIADAVKAVKSANPAALYCCDPVLGDTGRGFFVAADLPDFMRDVIAPLADILTPNLFELEALTGRVCGTVGAIRLALAELHARGPRVILVTSALTDDTPDGCFDMLASDSRTVWRVRTPRLDLHPNGAGDVTAALFLAHYLRTRDPAEALSRAASSVHGLLAATQAAQSPELCLIAAQDEFVVPRHMFKAEAV